MNSPSHASNKGSETILLVEDEPMVRKLVKQVLEMSGYRVLEAAEGRQALEHCEKHPGQIHLLLTDVVLPGMNGRELAEAVAELRPGVRVLWMTGYTDDHVLKRGIPPGADLLHKPFNPLDLTERVRALLGRAV